MLPSTTPNAYSVRVDHIERATAAAVPALHTELLTNIEPGWLVPMDGGTVGRAHSAVPLAHSKPDLRALPEVEHRYAAAGLAAVWRIPRVPAFEEFTIALTRRGYTRSQATAVQLAAIDLALHLADVAPCGPQIRVEPRAFQAWQDIFLGPGFDVQDARSRVSILARGQNTQYAVAQTANRPVCSGALSIYQPSGAKPIASVHGMRTLAANRGQGMAFSLLLHLAQLAGDEGCVQWFLQVEQTNAIAQGLYAKLGFRTAWIYDYWRLNPAS